MLKRIFVGKKDKEDRTSDAITLRKILLGYERKIY
jgi:hypothetical protein